MPEEKMAAAAQLQYWWLVAIVVFLVVVPLAVSWTNKRQNQDRHEGPGQTKGDQDSPEGP